MHSNKSSNWSTDKIPESILHHAKEMRKAVTEAEVFLWDGLRNRKLNGLKFRRQQHFEGFILDFYCHEASLGIEVDGKYHNKEEQKVFDEQRTQYLNEFGIEVIRFTNEQVINSIDNVLMKIRKVSEERIEKNPSPLPLSPGRGVAEERGRGEGQNKGESLTYFKFKSLLQRNNWISPAYVGVDENGVITYLSEAPPSDAFAMDSVDGFALAGFQNAHSHAFQYAMAGLAESHPPGTHDDFWTWREAMYQCALSASPDQVESIASMLYAEMVRHGYTQVAEFHYLHHDKDGKPYGNVAELGERIVAAAKTAGIKITLVPVFYQKGSFGQDPQPRQRRFISKSIDEYFNLFEASRKAAGNYKDASIGVSVHSLRAVDLNDIQRTLKSLPADLPFHMHVAEQKKEVKDCLEFVGKRPMQWVLDNLPVDNRFHLVHSTHLDDDELHRLAKSGANVVLCPSTEGNLGDGIFRMKEYVDLGGRWSIGTDSHIGIDPLEEFRMIDYHQRLITNARNTFGGDAAHYMVNEEIVSGRKAMGVSSRDNFEIGKPFDAVIFDGQAPLLNTTSAKHLAAAIVYSSDASSKLGTIINGRWIVKFNKHVMGKSIRSNFKSAIQQIGIR